MPRSLPFFGLWGHLGASCRYLIYCRTSSLPISRMDLVGLFFSRKPKNRRRISKYHSIVRGLRFAASKLIQYCANKSFQEKPAVFISTPLSPPILLANTKQKRGRYLLRPFLFDSSSSQTTNHYYSVVHAIMYKYIDICQVKARKITYRRLFPLVIASMTACALSALLIADTDLSLTRANRLRVVISPASSISTLRIGIKTVYHILKAI